MEEILFQGDCQLCLRKDTPCRNHHLIPVRLIKILPHKTTNEWKRKTIRICSSCNSYIHPENKLYKTIAFLKSQIGFQLNEREEYVMKESEQK